MTKLEKSNTESHQIFYDHYLNHSVSDSTKERFVSIKNSIFRLVKNINIKQNKELVVCDIGCNSGTQSSIWLAEGHQIFGIDINLPLLKLAKKRFDNINICLGSACSLPWKSRSFDICLVPELLEHVDKWEICLDEFARVLKPGGVLYISTTNTLCPKQQEFNLPFYSWYPKKLKKYCEKLAITSRPDLANYATFPAVNWFSFYSLKRELEKRNIMSYGRFDIIDTSNHNKFFKLIIKIIKTNSFMKLIGNVLTPYTVIIGVKRNI